MVALMFIDGAHIEFMTKRNPHKNRDHAITVNLAEFREWCMQETGLESIETSYYYNALPFTNKGGYAKMYTKRLAFFQAVKSRGFKLRLGMARHQKCPSPDCDYVDFQQKQVDMQMGLDIARALWMRDDVTDILMVTGDADFVPVVQAAVDSRKNLYLMYGDNTSAYLKDNTRIFRKRFTREILEQLPGTVTR